MDIDEIDSAALARWVARQLQGSALIGGLGPSFQVATGGTPGRGWTVVGTRTLPELTFDSMEAHSHPTLDDLLRMNPIPVVVEAERLLIQALDLADGGIASSFDAAHGSLAAAATAVLMPEFATYKFALPAWLGRPRAPPVIDVEADTLAPTEVVFLHPGPSTASHLVHTDSTVVRNGPESRVIISVLVARRAGIPLVPATRFTIG